MRLRRALFAVGLVLGPVVALVPAGQAGADVVTGNLVANGSFESGSVSPWGCNISCSATTTKAYAGSYSMVETGNGLGIGSNAYIGISGATSGATYTASVWALDSASTCNLEFEDDTGTWSQSTAGPAVLLSSTAWQEVTRTFTAPASSFTLSIGQDNCGGADTIYMDQVVLIAGSTAWDSGSSSTTTTTVASSGGTGSTCGGSGQPACTVSGSVTVTNQNAFGAANAGCGAKLTWNPLSWGSAVVSDSLCGLEQFFVPDSAHVAEITGLAQGTTGAASWINAGVSLASMPEAMVTAAQNSVGSPCPTGATFPGVSQSVGLCSALSSAEGSNTSLWSVVRAVVLTGWLVLVALGVFHFFVRVLQR